MKFTLNGLEVTCTPQEFNELRVLGAITTERPSVPTVSVVDACKAAGIPLEKTEGNIDWSKVAIWPPRNEGPGTKFPPVPRDSDLADTLPKSPDVDDAVALIKDYRPGCRYTYAIAMRRKDNIYTNYLRSTLGNSYTADITDAVQFAAPEDAFDFIDSRPDLNLCVLRVKVSE